MSEKGYSSNIIGSQWIETVFDAQTVHIANGRKRLLVVDGHASHFTWGSLNMLTAMALLSCACPHTPPMPYRVCTVTPCCTLELTHSLCSPGCIGVLSVQEEVCPNP